MEDQIEEKRIMRKRNSVPILLTLLLGLTACEGGTLAGHQAPASKDVGGAMALDSGASADQSPGGKPDPEFPGKDAAVKPRPDKSPPPPAPDLMPPKPDRKPPAIYGPRCPSPCAGTTRLINNAKYGIWIKVVRCSSTRYDLLMSTTKAGPFYKIGDTGGHGQDHCELVNPGFTIVLDDDIKSGSCKTCNIKSAGSISNIPAFKKSGVFYRSKFGEQFKFKPVSQVGWGIHISCWYECGVSL